MNIIINNVNNLNIYNTKLNPLKVCSQCNQNIPLKYYNTDKQKLDNLRCNCKSCQYITNNLYQDNLK